MEEEKYDLLNMYLAGPLGGDNYFGKVVSCLRLACFLLGGRIEDMVVVSDREGLRSSVVDGACDLFQGLLNKQILRAGPWTRYQVERISVLSF